MKKKVIMFLIFCTIAILLVVCYRDYGRKQAYGCARFLSILTQASPRKDKLIITDDVQIEKIIKQTPLNLFFLIKWGDGEKAYINLENWMTRAHDHIQVHPVDKSKSAIIYE